jgi:hypothetical protein
MSFEVKPSQSTSRRTIVKTSAKLAYAAPLVATSMRLSSARASVTVSGGGASACTVETVGAACTPPYGGGGAGVCQSDGRCCVPPDQFAGRLEGSCIAANCCEITTCAFNDGLCNRF